MNRKYNFCQKEGCSNPLHGKQIKYCSTECRQHVCSKAAGERRKENYVKSNKEYKNSYIPYQVPETNVNKSKKILLSVICFSLKMDTATTIAIYKRMGIFLKKEDGHAVISLKEVESAIRWCNNNLKNKYHYYMVETRNKQIVIWKKVEKEIRI